MFYVFCTTGKNTTGICLNLLDVVILLCSDTPEKKSQLSLTDDAPPESETDSMAEYYETDPSKFNEDGSFIGQYGGKV